MDIINILEYTTSESKILLQIEHQAHGSKTSDPCINREEDERLILRGDDTLREAGVKNETEISVFRRADYEEYKKDPALKW